MGEVVRLAETLFWLLVRRAMWENVAMREALFPKGAADASG